MLSQVPSLKTWTEKPPVNLFTLINARGIWQKFDAWPRLLDFEGENMIQKGNNHRDKDETESTEADFDIHLYPEPFIGRGKDPAMCGKK